MSLPLRFFRKSHRAQADYKLNQDIELENAEEAIYIADKVLEICSKLNKAA